MRAEDVAGLSRTNAGPLLAFALSGDARRTAVSGGPGVAQGDSVGSLLAEGLDARQVAALWVRPRLLREQNARGRVPLL